MAQKNKSTLYFYFQHCTLTYIFKENFDIQATFTAFSVTSNKACEEKGENTDTEYVQETVCGTLQVSS